MTERRRPAWPWAGARRRQAGAERRRTAWRFAPAAAPARRPRAAPLTSPRPPRADRLPMRPEEDEIDE